MALSREEIASRYGAALFGYAKDMKAVEPVWTEMQQLKQAVKENKGILKMLSDPILSKKEKKVSLQVIAKNFSPEVQAFLNLLLEYDRFAYLLDIIDQFNYFYDQAKSIAEGTATSAVKLSSDQLKRLGDSFAKKYHLKKVRLENKVDPSIIGGVILQVQDLVIDGSVKNGLKKIRAQLIKKD